MSSGSLVVHFFDEGGRSLGSNSIFLPEYLDRLDIEAKAVWFILRGMGDPKTKSVLLVSQGQQYLIPSLATPLRHLMYTELKENEHGLEEQVREYIDRYGLGKVLNQ